MSSSWPVTLRYGDLVIRPLRVSDYADWRQVRSANQQWLGEWEATSPRPRLEPAPTFRQSARKALRDARAGKAMPFVLEFQGKFVGQLNVSDITTGALWSAHMGYWIDEQVANQGIMTKAVALVTEHLFTHAKLHRVEIAIRPENVPSNRLVAKLGFQFEGVRKSFLHINGQWRDHNIYVMLQEDFSPGLVTKIAPH